MSTDEGQRLWNAIASEKINAEFTIIIKDLGKNTTGKVTNYKLNSQGSLASADILLTPQLLTTTNNKLLIPSGKEGYVDAVGFRNSDINRIVALAHELSHAEQALDPEIAKNLVNRDKYNKKIIAASNKPNYQKVYEQYFSKEGEIYKNANKKNEQNAVKTANRVGYEFNKLKRKIRRRLRQSIKKARIQAIKESRKNSK